MIGLTAVQARYTGFSPKNADEFTSASRSVKPGLIASAVVSAWTWAATLVSAPFACSRLWIDTHVQLQSSAVAYKYGISGPWWYGSGATVQVLLFAQVSDPAISLAFLDAHRLSFSSLPSSSSMPHMRIHSSKSSVLAGVRSPISSSCSLVSTVDQECCAIMR